MVLFNKVIRRIYGLFFKVREVDIENLLCFVSMLDLRFYVVGLDEELDEGYVDFNFFLCLFDLCFVLKMMEVIENNIVLEFYVFWRYCLGGVISYRVLCW